MTMLSVQTDFTEGDMGPRKAQAKAETHRQCYPQNHLAPDILLRELKWPVNYVWGLLLAQWTVSKGDRCSEIFQSEW